MTQKRQRFILNFLHKYEKQIFEKPQVKKKLVKVFENHNNALQTP
jgi:hypothetical protein